MSIKTRLLKIKQSAEQTRLVLKANSHRSIWAVRSLSDPANSYQIEINWFGTGEVGKINYATVSLSCEMVAAPDCPICQGQRGGWNCYHSLGALMTSAGMNSKDLLVFDTLDEAINSLSLDGGSLIKAYQGNGHCWGVVRSQQQKRQAEINQVAQNDPHLAARLQRMNDRVEIMRGPVEGGID